MLNHWQHQRKSVGTAWCPTLLREQRMARALFRHQSSWPIGRTHQGSRHWQAGRRHVDFYSSAWLLLSDSPDTLAFGECHASAAPRDAKRCGGVTGCDKKSNRAAHRHYRKNPAERSPPANIEKTRIPTNGRVITVFTSYEHQNTQFCLITTGTSTLDWTLSQVPDGDGGGPVKAIRRPTRRARLYR
jgi:hypothetical protein